MSAEQIIDWDLSLKLANNKEKLAQEMLEMYIQELPEFKQKISQSFADDDLDELQMQVHKLNGASCYCGVPKIKNNAATLETALKSADNKNIPTLVKSLLNNIDLVLKEYQEEKM